MDKPWKDLEQKLEMSTEKLLIKIDVLDSRLDSIDKKMVEHNADLKHHIFRTSLNEQRLELLERDLLPIKNHVIGINWAIKLMLTVGSLAAAAYAVTKLI